MSVCTIGILMNRRPGHLDRRVKQQANSSVMSDKGVVWGFAVQFPKKRNGELDERKRKYVLVEDIKYILRDGRGTPAR